MCVVPPFIFSLLGMFKFQSEQKIPAVHGQYVGSYCLSKNIQSSAFRFDLTKVYYGMTKCLIMSLRCGTHCEKKSSFYKKKNVSPTMDRTQFDQKVWNCSLTQIINMIDSPEISVGLKNFCICQTGNNRYYSGILAIMSKFKFAKERCNPN